MFWNLFFESPALVYNTIWQCFWLEIIVEWLFNFKIIMLGISFSIGINHTKLVMIFTNKSTVFGNNLWKTFWIGQRIFSRALCIIWGFTVAALIIGPRDTMCFANIIQTTALRKWQGMTLNFKVGNYLALPWIIIRLVCDNITHILFINFMSRFV